MVFRLVLSAFFSCIIFSVDAQKKEAGSFIHKVRRGETFRSIAALYELSGREVADFNNLEYYEGTLAAKTLRIPRKLAPIKEVIDSITVRDPILTNSTQTPTSQARVNDSANTIPAKSDYSAHADTVYINESADINNDTSTFKKNLPVIIYLSVSFLLLIAAIIYYRYVNRK